MTLVAEYCQRVVAEGDGQLTFTGNTNQAFRIRNQQTDFPLLLTVAQWEAALE